MVRRDDYLYNFWRDAANPRGLWRRTTLDSYRTDSPEWDVLIDVDELGRADGEKWVWAGAGVIYPEYTVRWSACPAAARTPRSCVNSTC